MTGEEESARLDRRKNSVKQKKKSRFSRFARKKSVDVPEIHETKIKKRSEREQKSACEEYAGTPRVFVGRFENFPDVAECVSTLLRTKVLHLDTSLKDDPFETTGAAALFRLTFRRRQNGFSGSLFLRF